jgi:hypothetical protein
MAAELDRFLSDFLKGHPEHRDREFLEAKKVETTDYLFTRDPEIANQAVDTARRKIQDLVDRNIERRGPLSGSIFLDHEGLKRHGNDRHGADFVGNLLPTSCREFAWIINGLGREKIRTKDDLIRSNNKKLRGAAEVRTNFILAMRDLAIAEKSQVT